MSSPMAISERVELARLCRSRDWSKAIRVLDSLISGSSSVQDICNRAFCYSQLELHKHVVKDCDRALLLDPALLQTYILKGLALSSLGRKDDAISAWEIGCERALCQSADLKQLLELEELLQKAKQIGDQVLAPHIKLSAPERANDEQNIAEESCRKQGKLSNLTSLCCEDTIGSTNFPDGNEMSMLSSGSDVNCNTSDSENVQIGSIGNFEKAGYANGLKITKKTSGSNLSDWSQSKSGIGLSKISGIENGGEKTMKIGENIQTERSDCTIRAKRFPLATLTKPKSISVDFRLSKGIANVNEGKYASAILVFDQILKDNPNYPEALIGRGTANAFQRELDAAIADFSHAIECNPAACEAWKRRGQARAALGESEEAIVDLTRALEFEPNSAEILHERGIVNFKFKDYCAAIDDLSVCIKLDKDYKTAYTYLGLSFSSVGDYERAEEYHLKAINLDRNLEEAWTNLILFYIDLAMTVKAFDAISQALRLDSRFWKVHLLRAKLLHGMGEHRKAIKDLSASLNLEKSSIDCLYLRASCYHAIGEYKEAVKDYDSTLDLEHDSLEKFSYQCLAFYQKEMALYAASKASSEFEWFDVDRDIDPLFKEYWCKKMHPKDVCEKVYRQPPLRESLEKVKHRKRDTPSDKRKSSILSFADLIGMKVQYDCVGFLPNQRQHRMAGLAAIEIAQKISKAWRSIHSELKHSHKSRSKYGKKPRRKMYTANQNRGGGNCSTSDTSTSCRATDDRPFSRPMMLWHDVYSLAVKWRQMSEPCDPVFWINKLSTQFLAGYRSRTPTVLGQAKIVRYYPYFDRIFNIAKSITRQNLYVHNATNGIIKISDSMLQQITEAETCRELYGVICEDFWVSTCCKSMAFDGKQLEGTRLSFAKLDGHVYEFAMRRPSASRWEEFDAEMAVAWENVCNMYCGEAYGSSSLDGLQSVVDSILQMTYYWYNFVPLTHGSAEVGFAVFLGLLLAANIHLTGQIPKNVQLDLEAILFSDPTAFVDSVKPWLNPMLESSSSWKDLPDIGFTFSTTGTVVAALSSED